jgi:hypothetical protein
LSDQYAHLFLSHNFGGLLFKSGKFQPGVTLHNNIGWGNLSSRNRASNLLIDYKIKNKVFMESGLQLDNIFKTNYADVGYLGLGAGVFYRYGSYENESANDNFVFKLSATFTIK